MHDQNCFITLTYNPQYLPSNLSLDVSHFQLFMKRLRKKHKYKKIRFYMSGEYGTELGRPHYHALIFNHDFTDKKLWKMNNDIPLYISDELSKLWGLGFCSLGAVTFQSAAYVSRYIMKKVTGQPAGQHYEYVNPDTGIIYDRKPEYSTMSLKPGIGYSWLQKYKSDVFPSDFLVLDGVKMKPPRYYDKILELEKTEERKRRMARIKIGKSHPEDQIPARLKVRETVQNARLIQLPRKEL